MNTSERFALLAAVLLVTMAFGWTPTGSAQEATPQASPVAASASASGTPRFGVRPEGEGDLAPFGFELDPGQGSAATLVVNNSGDLPIELITYTADVTSSTNGGFTMQSAEDEPEGQTLWFDIPSEPYTLAPGESRSIDFTVTVPEGTAPGEYASGIATETVESFGVDGTDALRQKSRKANVVLISVPGPFEAGFALGDPSIEVAPDSTLITVPIENSGNTRVYPVGTITLFDAAGTELATMPVEMGIVFAFTSTLIQIGIAAPLPEGEYLLSATLADETTGATASLTDVPVTTQVADTGAEETEQPVTIDSASIEPNADPIQFANVSLDVGNTGQDLAASRVILNVYKDGELVEDFVVSENVPLPNGTTTFQARYIPITGWESGNWTFSLQVFAVDPGSNVQSLLASTENVASIVVP